MPPARLVPVLAAGLILAASAGAQPVSGPDVRLEGSGAHRRECDATQLKPFDASMLANLSKWSGTAVTPETLKGKAVLLVTWTSYAKTTNNAAISLAQRLHAQNADKGLVVIGVHNPKGFDSAKAVADELKITFPYAADEAGKVRAALHADEDPDFFLVDRAGNMRFADIETSSVARAVEFVLSETPEQAAAAPAAAAKALADQDRERQRVRDVRGVVVPGQPLTVTFEPPPEEAYKDARFPAIITKTGLSEWDTFAEDIRKNQPQMALNDEGWAGNHPVLTGRVLLIYTFDPLDTQIKSVADTMSRLQTAHARDLVVAANLVKIDDRNSNTTEEEKQRQQERRAQQAKQYVTETALNHAMNVVPLQVNGRDLNQIVIPIDSRQHLTLAFLVSSDGHCRWVGNPYWDGFPTVVKQFIDADPGVKARRRAEDAQAK